MALTLEDIKKKDLPTLPGIYMMKNGDKIIYVGKAKNLKNRVSSYFNREHDREKTRELVKYIEDIEIIICNSELDALILENNLIKKYMPKYNILLKDEKTYPYIKLSRENYPSLRIIRTTKALNTKNGYFYGPYPFGAWGLKKALIRIFKLRDCNRDMSKNYARPCLKYHMNMCPAPCHYKNILDEYKNQVEKTKRVLQGHTSEVIKDLTREMQSSSEIMNFERAITLRNEIRELENIRNNQVNEYGRELDEDIFTLKIEGDILFICVLNVRNGKMFGKISTNINIKNKIYEDLVQSVVSRFYEKHPIPKDITFENEYKETLTPIKKLLELKTNRIVNFHFPKIKSRRKLLMEMANLNLDRDVENYYNKKSVIEDGLYKIYTKLSLKNYPRKIECFDISNIQGKDAVASMSVAVEGKASKKDYRKFKIECKDTPDDFAMMREVITRRYSRLSPGEFPDVILIDGGLGQINAVGKILENLGKLGIADLLSLAKRDEEIYKYGESTPYSFPKDWEALKIFQRVRDEAHRFGITYHRKLRSKRVISSQLDEVIGIGEKRKKILLDEFGSVAKILKQDEITLSKFVPKNVAHEILKLKKSVFNLFK